MTEQKPISLAGQRARIQRTPKDYGFVVLFGADVVETMASGAQVPSKEPPALHPEITGHLETKEDYSDVKDAELILDDQRIFRITFHSPKYFSAYEPFNSRTRVYPE